MGAKIAHFAEPEEKKISINVHRTMKAMIIGIPVNPTVSRKSAPAIAEIVPMLVQLNRPWNCPPKKQKAT